MAWKPERLTREQMEERRLEGGRQLKGDRWSQAEIARQLSVSRATVSDWAKQLAEGGLHALRRRRGAGRPPKLTRLQQQALRRRLKRGALAAGFPTDRWTLKRVQRVIEREFGVGYHPNYLNRLLRKLGLSPQAPLPQAIERDAEVIRAWLEQDWPRIKKGAAKQRRNRVFR